MISVVLCSAAADASRLARAEKHFGELLVGADFEVVALRATSIAEGYNRGVAQTRGDIVVFAADDVEVSAKGLAGILEGHLAKVDIVGVAGATRVAAGPWHAAAPPYVLGQLAYAAPGGGFRVVSLVAHVPLHLGVQVLSGTFFACRRSVFATRRFDEATFDGEDGWDLDFTFGAHLSGLTLGVCTDVHVIAHGTERPIERTHRAWIERYAGKLTAPPSSTYALAAIDVATKEEALACLRTGTTESVAPAAVAGAAPLISVIVCNVDPIRFAKIEAHYAAVLAGSPYELVAIHDARSLAEGYGRGIDRSRGEILVFSHDDIEILTPDLAPRLRAHLARFDIVGVAGATRVASARWHAAGPLHAYGQVAHPEKDGRGFNVFVMMAPGPAVAGIHVLDGLFIACRRSVVARHRFDAVTFDGFHGYDVDFTFGAHRAGMSIGVATDIAILHASAGKFDEAWEEYARRFAEKYAGCLAPDRRGSYELAWVKVATKDEVVRRIAPWYASAPPVEATKPHTTANVRVLFVGNGRDVPYTVEVCARSNGLFSRIATFKPDVIVTSEAIPASLDVAPFEIRKRWIHLAKDLPIEEVTAAIEACYAGVLWGHENERLQPLVSVFTGTYNTGDFLRDTYQSLREQTYANWEWLVVDDGSTDGTWERLLAIASEDIRVRPFRGLHSQGRIGAVKDTATRLANGVWVVELDHDDMLTDDALAEIKAAFEANPDCGMVYSNFAEFFQDGRPSRYGGEFWEKRYRETFYRGKRYEECRTPDIYGAFGDDVGDQFAWFLTVGPNHVRAFRTEELRRLGGYNRNLPVADDWDVIARFFLHSKICHVDKLLYLYRFLDSAGNTTFVRNQSIQDHLQLARRHYADAFAKTNEGRLARDRTVSLPTTRSPRPKGAPRHDVLVSGLESVVGDRPRWPAETLAKSSAVVSGDADIVFFAAPALGRAIVEHRDALGLLARTRLGALPEAPRTAKLSMLRRAITTDPFGGTRFAWVDLEAETLPELAGDDDEKVRVHIVDDVLAPRGWRVTTEVLSGSRHAVARICRFVALRMRRARATVRDEDVLTDLVDEHPELFDVLRRETMGLVDRMRELRAAHDYAGGCAIGERVVAEHREGRLAVSPDTLSALLDEYFIAAFYKDAPDQTLARSIALYYVDLADRDPRFLAAFLLDFAHIRENFGFLKEPVFEA